MKFTQQKIYLVIALTLTALVGLVAIQTTWISGAIELKRQQFDKDTLGMMGDVGRSVAKDTLLLNELQTLIETGETERPKQELIAELRTLLDSTFRAENLDIEYEFGIISTKLKDKTPWLSSTQAMIPQLIKSQYRSCGSLFNTLASLHFIFPDKESFIERQVGTLAATSALFVLIITGCFAYVIITVRRQKKLSDMKNDFINNMTHEFKTPIFSISLASKTLGKSSAITNSEKLSSYLKLIENENGRLKNQVDKVLQIALLDSGNFQLDKKNINLHQLIRSVVKSFELILSEKNGSLKLDLNSESETLYADETHISNIIYNLVDNAMKYTGETPEICISTESSDEGISLTVKDNGIGMDVEAQKYVFDKFYRAPTGNIHNVKGFGLGLSYVKSIVDAHKGDIRLHSKVNQGTEFTVFLPSLSTT